MITINYWAGALPLNYGARQRSGRIRTCASRLLGGDGVNRTLIGWLQAIRASVITSPPNLVIYLIHVCAIIDKCPLLKPKAQAVKRARLDTEHAANRK